MSQGGDPRIGTEVAGFRIEALIGRGGMGVVYLAEQLRYGRKVALKILAPELASDESFRDRFEQEWRTAARLEHPNIVPIYEAGEAEGVFYIAMRYVEGIDLNALLSREGRLDPARALAIVGQVGVALDAAHAQGLVHRDVKPGNILIGGRGLEGEHVYLTDFGVAKQTRTRTGLTRTGLFIGTVDYAAPEQIEGKLLDGRTDVYALGCVLYQCLTGVLPYEKDSEVAMLYAHLLEPPPSLNAKRPDVPEALDAVIVKALAKEPNERYGTCRELIEDGRRAAGLTLGAARTVLDMPATSLSPARPTTPEPLPVAAKPGRPWWRTRAAMIGLAAVVIAGAGAGIGIAIAGGGGGGGETTEAAGPTSAGGSTAETSETGDTGETGETGVPTDPTTETSETATTETGTTGTESDFPNAEETALLAHVPESTRPKCVRESEASLAPEAIAGVDCPRGKVRVFYDMFPDVEGMNAYYDDQVERVGAERDSGVCNSAATVEGTWVDVNDEVRGRLLCYTESDQRIVIWKDDQLKIVGWIIRNEPNRNLAYQFWRGAGAQLLP